MTTTARLHPGSFLLGSTRELLANQVDFLASTYDGEHDVVRFRIGPPGPLRRELHAAHSPEAAEQMLSAKTFAGWRKDNVFYDEIRLALGNGILTAQDEDWLRQKRFVQPVFTRARVDGYLEAMVDEIAKTIGGWKQRDVGEVDLHVEMTELTLAIVARTLFGDDLHELAEQVSDWSPVANAAILGRVALPARVPLSWPLPVNRTIRAAQEQLYAVCDEIIRRRRAGIDVGDDLASLLIHVRDGADALSDEEIRDQMLVFLLAGHETTSTSLTFALHLLAKHPEVQQAVLDEVTAVLGDAAPTPAQAHSGLPYTTAVLKEAMRLYPAAPFTGRRTVEDTDLCGVRVPAGSDVVVSTWSIHRRPDLWPDPERFDPTRFLGEAEKGRHRYAWMPFGAGPRACIGQHFSMLESVAALAMLVRAFELEDRTGGEVRVASAITLFPLDPVRTAIRPRQRGMKTQ